MKQKTPQAGKKPKEEKNLGTLIRDELVSARKERAKTPKVELVSFSIKATIPTQQYGNLMPEIVVKAPTIEIARDAVMPIIEDMYQAYAETPMNGRIPSFFKTKAHVTVTEKKVEPETITPAPVTPQVVNNRTGEVVAQKEVLMAPVENSIGKEPEAPKSAAPAVKTDAYIKAENAIASAVSEEALNLLQEKINISTKINPADKPFLIDIILKKKFSLN